MTRVNTICGKSPALYLEGYVLVLFNHICTCFSLAAHCWVPCRSVWQCLPEREAGNFFPLFHLNISHKKVLIFMLKNTIWKPSESGISLCCRRSSSGGRRHIVKNSTDEKRDDNDNIHGGDEHLVNIEEAVESWKYWEEILPQSPLCVVVYIQHSNKIWFVPEHLHLYK